MKNLWGCYTLAFLLTSFCLTGVAAETKSKSTKSKSAAKDKVSFRLPRYFASIVDEEQRAEIYEIQKSYHAEIAKLQAELAALQSEQLEEIEGVLSKTQLASLNEMREGTAVAKKTSGSKKSTSRKSVQKNDSDDDSEEDELDDESTEKSSKKSSSRSSKASKKSRSK